MFCGAPLVLTICSPLLHLYRSSTHNAAATNLHAPLLVYLHRCQSACTAAILGLWLAIIACSEDRWHEFAKLQSTSLKKTLVLSNQSPQPSLSEEKLLSISASSMAVTWAAILLTLLLTGRSSELKTALVRSIATDPTVPTMMLEE